MKVGLITIHSKMNYGALFQTYALQKVIKDLGNNVEIIDYWPSFRRYNYCRFIRAIKRQDKKISIRYIIGISYTAVVDFFNLRRRITSVKYFKSFHTKYLSLSKYSYYSDDDFTIHRPEYDIYIAGSDQIWNPNITGNRLDPAYFLSFVLNPTICSSYATSAGSDAVDVQYLPKFKEYLNNFSHISVRESSLVTFIESECGKHAISVIDPTLLLTKSDWEDTIINPKKISTNFVLIFSLGSGKRLFPLAERIAKAFNLNLKYIGSGKSRYLPLEENVKPGEWQWYFKHAEFIVTNSFHGTMFSIIYNKPFYTIHNSSNSTRIKDHLNMLGLIDRYSTSGDNILDLNKNINYDDVLLKLNIEKEKALAYIRQILMITK